MAYANGYLANRSSISGSIGTNSSASWSNPLNVTLKVVWRVNCSSSANFYTTIFVYNNGTHISTIQKNSSGSGTITLAPNQYIQFKSETNSSGSYTLNLSLN